MGNRYIEVGDVMGFEIIFSTEMQITCQSHVPFFPIRYTRQQVKTSLKLQEVIFRGLNYSISISSIWLQTAPVECGPFFCLWASSWLVYWLLFILLAAPQVVPWFICLPLFHVLAIFKWPISQDLIGQSDLLYELHLLGHLHDNGNLNVTDCWTNETRVAFQNNVNAGPLEAWT